MEHNCINESKNNNNKIIFKLNFISLLNVNES